MERFLNKNSEKKLVNIPVGYQALIESFGLSTLPHFRQSYIALHGRGQIRIELNQEIHIYPKSYAVKEPGNPFNQLEFAIKYDGINLEILDAIFKKLEVNEVEAFIKRSPTSKYVRIIWFLYEFLTQTTLNIPDTHKLPYVDVLDPRQYFTSKGIRSSRHGINNNLLGTSAFCPTIRKTKILTDHINKRYDEQTKTTAKKYDPKIIARASYYLYTKETLSSYEIERERPSKERMSRFINLLHTAANIDVLTKKQLIELQNVIVDPRFKDLDYRQEQNYVGENINQYIQKIHYISPKPENVESLMSGLLEALEHIKNSEIHPVILAAAISFGFVFIHPFEDGNGRIHRFLIHYVLSKNFTPRGIIFPISAVMLQNLHEYDRVLELFSIPLMNLITQYHLSPDGILTVKQPTHHFYKYIDYTKMAEYLFDCIEKTLHEHFEREIEFLIKYDQTKREIQEIIDMPDKLIDLFIKFVMQNHGVLSHQKRNKYFYKLNDEEINKLQSVVKEHMLETT